MEPSGRNQWQPVAKKRVKQADPQAVATPGNRFAAHGKEGVDGSSPSEAFSSCLLSRMERLKSQAAQPVAAGAEVRPP
jgi:hypothetical protein